MKFTLCTFISTYATCPANLINTDLSPQQYRGSCIKNCVLGRRSDGLFFASVLRPAVVEPPATRTDRPTDRPTDHVNRNWKGLEAKGRNQKQVKSNRFLHTVHCKRASELLCAYFKRTSKRYTVRTQRTATQESNEHSCGQERW
jgi:hypothetical protein